MIGVMTLDRKYTIIPGNVAHHQSYTSGQVMIRRIDGLHNPPTPDPKRIQDAVDRIVPLGHEMINAGASILVLSCGFFSIVQRQLQPRFPIPLISSPIQLVPGLLDSIGSDEKLGLVSLYSEDLSYDYFQPCGVRIQDMARIALSDMTQAREFRRIIKEDAANADIEKWEAEVVEACVTLLRSEPMVRALVLECSDLPPFRQSINESLGIPVFDYFSLISFYMPEARRHI